MSSKVLVRFIPYLAVMALQYLFAKDALSYGSPYVLMSIRYLVVAAIILAIARKVIMTKDTIVVAGAFSGSTLFWILGLQYVSPGDSAILNYTMPLFAIPVAVLLARERPSRWEIVGSSVGFFGVILYSLTLSHGSPLVGVVLTITGAVCWAVLSVYYRKLKSQAALPILAAQFLLGSVPFLIGSAIDPGVNFAPGFFIDLGYLVVFGGLVQYFLWNSLLRYQTVGKVTPMTFAVPAVTLAIQSTLAFRVPAALSILGAAVMFTGILIAYRDNSTRSAIRPGSPVIEKPIRGSH